MKQFKKHIKIELIILAFLCLSAIILVLFARNHMNNYQENVIELRGDLSSKEIDVQDFSKFFAETDIKVQLMKGDPKVVIESQDEIIDNIDVINKGDLLELRTKDNHIGIAKELRDISLITVYYNDLSEIRVDRNCFVNVKDTLMMDPLKFDTQGNASLIVNAKTQQINVLSGGNSNITIYGSSNFIEGYSQGNSTLNAKSLKVKEANVSSGGNSSLRVRVSEKIEGHASGNSSLYIKGNPTNRRTNATGNARIVE